MANQCSSVTPKSKMIEIQNNKIMIERAGYNEKITFQTGLFIQDLYIWKWMTHSLLKSDDLDNKTRKVLTTLIPPGTTRPSAAACT